MGILTEKLAAAYLEENLKTIFAYSLSRVSDKDDAEDLTNDIVVAVMQSVHNLKNDKAFYGFLWKIARNTCNTFLRRRSKSQIAYDYSQIFVSVPDDNANIELSLCKNEDISALRREVALLQRQYRECTVDYYYSAMPIKDIAAKRGISAEMVKYYLFKTRKILKEGIAMERQFGEKSFNPAPFELQIIYNGSQSDMFDNLFKNRKLPGQIMLTAYYTTMSINELSVELGMPTVYLEDELEILQKNNFIKKVSKDKYQTNILIFNDDFYADAWNFAKSELSADVKSAVQNLKAKLPTVRNIGFAGGNIDDDLLTWDMITMCLWDAYIELPRAEFEKLYDKTDGVCCGMSCGGDSNIYHLARNFCGTRHENGKTASFFTVEPFYHAGGRKFDLKKDTYLYINNYCDLIDEAQKHPDNAKIAVFTKDELGKVKEIIANERAKISQIIDRYNKKCTEIMLSRAPIGVSVTPEQMLNINIANVIGAIADLAIETESVSVYPLEEYPALYGLID